MLEIVRKAEELIDLIHGKKPADRVHDLFRSHPEDDDYVNEYPDNPEEEPEEDYEELKALKKKRDQLITELQHLSNEIERKAPGDDESVRTYAHSFSGMGGGSFIYTPVGYGTDKKHNTLTRFSPQK